MRYIRTLCLRFARAHRPLWLTLAWGIAGLLLVLLLIVRQVSRDPDVILPESARFILNSADWALFLFVVGLILSTLPNFLHAWVVAHFNSRIGSSKTFFSNHDLSKAVGQSLRLILLDAADSQDGGHLPRVSSENARNWLREHADSVPDRWGDFVATEACNPDSPYKALFEKTLWRFVEKRDAPVLAQGLWRHVLRYLNGGDPLPFACDSAAMDAIEERLNSRFGEALWEYTKDDFVNGGAESEAMNLLIASQLLQRTTAMAEGIGGLSAAVKDLADEWNEHKDAVEGKLRRLEKGQRWALRLLQANTKALDRIETQIRTLADITQENDAKTHSLLRTIETSITQAAAASPARIENPDTQAAKAFEAGRFEASPHIQSRTAVLCVNVTKARIDELFPQRPLDQQGRPNIDVWRCDDNYPWQRCDLLAGQHTVSADAGTDAIASLNHTRIIAILGTHAPTGFAAQGHKYVSDLLNRYADLSSPQVVVCDDGRSDDVSSRTNDNALFTYARDLNAHFHLRSDGVTISDIIQHLDNNRPDAILLRIAAGPKSESPPIGRGKQLNEMCRLWSNGHRFIAITAGLGEGTTSLTTFWACSCLAFSQTRIFRFGFEKNDARTSVDEFFNRAHEFFSITVPSSQSSATENARRLYKAIQETNSLLIIEDYNAGLVSNGAITDDGIRMLQKLFESPSPGRNAGCLFISTQSLGSHRVHVPPLDQTSGARVLLSQGLRGSLDELKQLSVKWGGSPLILRALAASSTRPAFSATDELTLPTTEKWHSLLESLRHDLEANVRHVVFILSAYGLCHGATFTDIREISFTLCANGPVCFSENDLRSAVTRAVDCHFLIAETKHNEVSTVRFSNAIYSRFFSTAFRQQSPHEWANLHATIGEYLVKGINSPPRSEGGLMRVESAIRHYQQAGRHHEALTNLYIPLVKGDFHLCTNTKLNGRFDSDLDILKGFFVNRWSKVHDSISTNLAELAYEAGFALRANGRLTESLGAFNAAAHAFQQKNQQTREAATYGDIALIHVLLADIDRAFDSATTAVNTSDRSGDIREQVRQRSNLVLVHLMMADFVAAQVVVNEAARIVGDNNTLSPSFWFSLYSVVTGKRLPSPLKQTPGKESMTGMPTLDAGLEWLIKGRRALAKIAKGTRTQRLINECAHYFDSAVACLNEANTDHHKPRALLGRAEFYIETLQFDCARDDLISAREISDFHEYELYRLECRWLGVLLESRRADGQCVMREDAEALRKECKKRGYRARANDLARYLQTEDT